MVLSTMQIYDGTTVRNTNVYRDFFPLMKQAGERLKGKISHRCSTETFALIIIIILLLKQSLNHSIHSQSLSDRGGGSLPSLLDKLSSILLIETCPFY